MGFGVTGFLIFKVAAGITGVKRIKILGTQQISMALLSCNLDVQSRC